MGVKPKILGVGGGLGVRGGGRAGIDWSDDDAHQASSGSRASYDARHDIDAKASKDFKEASDYFTSRKVSESGSHTDNNADSRVDQLSAALNSAKQSYDQYTTNMTRSHEYAEMASRTESMRADERRFVATVCTVCDETRTAGCRSYSDKYQFAGDCRTPSGNGPVFCAGTDTARC